MSNLVILTSEGLNKINEASQYGTLIDIAYYVPSYDYRIDPNVYPLAGCDPEDITTVFSETDTKPSGNILWRKEGSLYELSDSDNTRYIPKTSTTTGVGTSGMTNPGQEGSSSVNMLDDELVGRPNGAYFDGYYYSPKSSSEYNNGIWTTTDPSGWVDVDVSDYEPNDPDAPTEAYLYSGVTYSSVISSASDKRANFRITMNNIGNAKFNTIGLYAVMRDGSDLIGVSPFLFAQVIIPQPQVIDTSVTTVGSGTVGSLVLDLQLDSVAASTDFENIFYSTSGDYWQRVSNNVDGNYGLAYSGNIYVANRLAVDDKNFWTSATTGDTGVAKLFVSTFEKINNEYSTIESSMPQICAQYVTAPIGVSASKRIRTTFRTNPDGNCEVDFYGACLSDESVYSLIPKTDDDFGIGNSDNRWRKMYLSDFLSVRGDAVGIAPADYFEVDLDSGYTHTNNEFFVADKIVKSTVCNMFVRANIKARDGEKLYIRSSTDNDLDTDMWIVAGNYESTNKGTSSVTTLGSSSKIITESIINAYKAIDYYVQDSWIFDEMSNYPGGLYLAGNGYIYMMGSAVFMENAVPAVDVWYKSDAGVDTSVNASYRSGITLGIEDDGNGFPKAFAKLVVSALANRDREISITSDLVPRYSDYTNGILPSLGNGNNRFTYMYAETVSCSYISDVVDMYTESLYVSDSIDASRAVGESKFNKLTVTDLTVLGSLNSMSFINTGLFTVATANPTPEQWVMTATKESTTLSMYNTENGWSWKIYKNLFTQELKIDLVISSSDTKLKQMSGGRAYFANDVLVTGDFSSLMSLCGIVLDSSYSYDSSISNYITFNKTEKSGARPPSSVKAIFSVAGSVVKLVADDDFTATYTTNTPGHTGDAVYYELMSNYNFSVANDVTVSFNIPKEAITNYDFIITTT